MYERLRYACADLDKDIGMERPEAERFSSRIDISIRRNERGRAETCGGPGQGLRDAYMYSYACIS